LLLVHVPPEVELPRVVLVPEQAFKVPVIVAGLAVTVAMTDALQPVLNEYVMFAVPAPMPESTPVELIVAVVVVPPVQEPLLIVAASVVVAPGHTAGVPRMAGASLTVTTIDRAQPVLKM
jgi:hypothetical protein